MDHETIKGIVALCTELIECGDSDDAADIVRKELQPLIEASANDEVNLFIATGAFWGLAARMRGIAQSQAAWATIMDIVENAILSNHHFYNRIEFLARISKRIGWNERSVKYYEYLLELVRPGASEENNEYYELAMDELPQLYDIVGETKKRELIVNEKMDYESQQKRADELMRKRLFDDFW